MANYFDTVFVSARRLVSGHYPCGPDHVGVREVEGCSLAELDRHRTLISAP
ncbi:hypothetical protein [Streptomyces albiflavescens]|uniref:hypothetical protein n=1 Tax=Streptomyces albiflavescens TaxID=1623582 RepID=UPI00166BF196|nr:hypothetical protein [Streptomyces albiflavescens]